MTLFLTMMLAVVSAVAIIYSIVIVYVPAKTVLDSNLQGPKMCTSLSMAQEVTGVENCEGWTSCHEWCLSKVSFSLKKMGKKLEKKTIIKGDSVSKFVQGGLLWHCFFKHIFLHV